jgi:hypothetical protein
MEFRIMTRTPRVIRSFSRTLPSLLLLMLAASGLFSCSRKNGVVPNSAQGSNNPPLTSPVPETSATEGETATAKPSPARKIFKTGEAVPAGYLGYKVYGSWFSDHLSPQGVGKQSPAGSYLYVDLGIVNTDKKERGIAPFKLIDERRKEYSPSEKAWKMEKSVGQIGMLVPSVGKRGFVIFEAPRNHQYKLKVQSFSAADEIIIELSPTAAPPSQ